MKNLKFGALFLGLAAMVGGAVAILGAQETRIQVPRATATGRGLMVLDGRGSQLGVMVSDLDAKTAGTTGGVRVDEVNAESPAEKAGLKAGDVVVEYDGERVRSARQLTRLIQETAEGRSVRIGVMRDGKRQTMDATPESRAEVGLNMNWDGDRIQREFDMHLRGLQGFGTEPPAFRFEPGDRTYDFRLDGVPMRSRPRLGVNVQELSTDLAAYFGVKEGGALVSSVTRGSAAEKAGLKAGDVIVSVNGDRVRDGDSLISELRGATGEITLGVVRDKKEITLKATIEAPRTERPRAGSRPGLML